MTKHDQAYNLARQAAALDFNMALQGLLAGYSATIEDMKERLTRKDAALLASLALSKKGTRINADEGLAKTVRAGIEQGTGLSQVEREFLTQVKDT